MRGARHLLWVVPVVGVALFVGLRHVAEVRHWDAMLAEVAAVEARSRAPRTRESIVGPTEEGRAWVHYEAALESIRRSSGSLAEIHKNVAGSTAESRAVRVRWLEQHAPTLRALRRGLHARDLTPLSAGASRSDVAPYFEEIVILADLCVADAVQHLEAGRAREAARGLLEALQFGHDLLEHPSRYTVGAGRGADRVLLVFEERGLGEFSAAALDDLEVGLARLDATWPRTIPCLEAAVAQLARGAEDGIPSWLPGDQGWSWRYLGSERVGFADGIRTTLELVAQLGPEPARASLERVEGFRASLRSSSNPVVREFGTEWDLFLRAHRHAAVELRSLRCGLAVARGRPAPAVDDPWELGTTVVEEDGQVVVRTPRGFGSPPLEFRVRR